MADYVVEKNKKGFLWGILTGLAAGATLGVLFAPDKGEETRKKLKAQSSKLKKEAEEALEELGETIEPWVEEVQEKIEPVLEEIDEATGPVQEKARRVVESTKRRFFKNIKK